MRLPEQPEGRNAGCASRAEGTGEHRPGAVPAAEAQCAHQAGAVRTYARVSSARGLPQCAPEVGGGSDSWEHYNWIWWYVVIALDTGGLAQSLRSREALCAAWKQFLNTHLGLRIVWNRNNCPDEPVVGRPFCLRTRRDATPRAIAAAVLRSERSFEAQG